MFITVIGGGNSTPIFATQAVLAGHKVAILTRKPEKWAKDLVIGFKNEDPTYLDGQEDFTAKVELITDDPAKCIPQSDMVFIAGVPIHFNREVLEKIKPHLKLTREKPVMIGSICSYGGFNWLVAEVLGKGNYIIMGTGQIPWTCGTIEYGKTGAVYGQKAVLNLTTESGKDEHGLRKIFTDILKLKDFKHTDFLASTLWPNNPSIHPPILYGLFKDWDYENGETFELGTEKAPILIYTDITKKSADYLDKLNKEQLAIVKALSKVYPKNVLLKDPGFDYKTSLVLAYGDLVTDPSTVYTAIRSCKAYVKHKNPYIVVETEETKKQKGENGEAKKKIMVKPNVDHKFFTTDLPYGLCTYKDIAKMLGVKTPLMDEIIYWNQKLIGKEYLVDDEFTGKDCAEAILPSRLGLTKNTLHKRFKE